jgi:simple sugar transport system ATP-binding protein
MMVGAEFEKRYRKATSKTANPILKMNDVDLHDNRGIKVLSNVSLELFPGEIAGLAGIEGNGSDFLAEAIMGLAHVGKGSVTYQGKDVTHRSPEERMRLGMMYIPSTNSIISSFSIAMNSILDYPDREPFSSRGILNWKEISNHATRIVARYNVVTPTIDLPAEKLSGGNRQRLALGRKLEANPMLLVAYHPTKGLDVSSQNYIYDRFAEMRDSGATIFFFGTDLDELYQLCNRLFVIYRGQIVGQFDDLNDVSKIDVGLLMTGGARYEREEYSDDSK